MTFDFSWSQMPSYEVNHNSLLRTFTKRSITSVQVFIQVNKLDYVIQKVIITFETFFLFLVSSYEYLERLEDKLESAYSFSYFFLK
jgi:hypothetical protein